MKKIVIGAIVGGLIIFICQTLSWTILDLHRSANMYTAQQDEIMTFLNSKFSEDGSYFLPTYPAGSSNEVMEQYMRTAEGKPWAVIAYHKEMKMNMGMNIFRGLIIDIIMVGLFCWILSKFANPRFSNVFLSSLFVGLIAFLNFPYTVHIWYETFDISASLIDAIAGWGLAGLWLGWWYGHSTKVTVVVR
jgi:hypothetical protein